MQFSASYTAIEYKEFDSGWCTRHVASANMVSDDVSCEYDFGRMQWSTLWASGHLQFMKQLTCA